MEISCLFWSGKVSVWFCCSCVCVVCLLGFCCFCLVVVFLVVGGRGGVRGWGWGGVVFVVVDNIQLK